jgi:UDP-N-acetylglucosamine diphosphorylase / glucose-1-phosphate thymidylyltransferase / UDP-N-acetylgalactosamine diphosphorylase / glucosamine-1-phosphate N-acetyltransferase / galactosamine-1-phosphate N-acetyltransferase
MIDINSFVDGFATRATELAGLQPWQAIATISDFISRNIASIDASYKIRNGIAVHNSAIIETGALLKPPVIIGKNSFIAANACLRGGVYIADGVKIGMGCEIKSSFVFNNSAIAHFNFIGDSIIGNNVNFEAGSITANHFNERTNKEISVLYNGIAIRTGVEKFGSLVGDHTKIGANAVLSPGTILSPGSTIKRLELVDQLQNM